MQHLFIKYIAPLVYIFFFIITTNAQSPRSIGNQRDDTDIEKEDDKGEYIPPDVRTWKLRDHFTFSDTVAVDTLSDRYQVYNQIYKESIANVYLGNMGSAYQSILFDERQSRYGFMFYNSLLNYIPEPEELYFYNTKTPYVNLSYHFGGPKRRSEELISALFTQNINSKWNIGIQYKLASSIGQYLAQKTENQNLKFFSSYNGKRYNFHAAILYTKINNSENGGINMTDAQKEFHELEPEEIPVNFQSANNKISNTHFFFNQSLAIGNINVKSNDSTYTELPVSTIYHTLDFDRSKRIYKIDDLQSYYLAGYDNAFYPNIYSDTLQTRDSIFYNNLSNTFQIKFNEEANALLKFGLRAYLTNEINYYKYPAQPTIYNIENGKYTPRYVNNDTTLVNSAIGGQVFKNLGKNFWWNAGMKLYFQGYRAGDSEITGKINSSFRIKNDTAGFFANGGIYLRSPEFFEEQYYSNHVKWNKNFNKVKTLRLNGGISVPTKRFEISAGTNIINDYIYWDIDGTPRQTNNVLQIINARLRKHFIAGRIHSVNDIVFQNSSDQDYIPLPTFALYNSTYYQNTLFKVLFFQIGFDLRYHTEYYAPAYMPATSTFVNQHYEKIGDYPFMGAFVNMQLKRARIFVKFDHVNQGFPNKAYYQTYQYPANIRSLKFGVSWNFYD